MGREPGWTLRRRLQVIITLALLPVVLVSIFQGVARARMDIANVHERLLQSARTAAAGDQNLLAAAEQVLRAVASLSEVRGMNGNCDGVLADTLIGVRLARRLALRTPNAAAWLYLPSRGNKSRYMPLKKPPVLPSITS